MNVWQMKVELDSVDANLLGLADLPMWGVGTVNRVDKGLFLAGATMYPRMRTHRQQKVSACNGSVSSATWRFFITAAGRGEQVRARIGREGSCALRCLK